MNAISKPAEIGEATVRAKSLLRAMSATDAARRMAAEFHVCVYESHGGIWGSFYETDRNEVVRRLA